MRGVVQQAERRRRSVPPMDKEDLELCLAHLDAAERLLEEARDLASLARLALVIDLLRRAHGLSERVPEPLV